MRAAVQAMFIADDPILEIDLERQAASGEQFERSIDGGVPDARVLHFDQSMQVFCAEMFACVEEDLEHSVALGTLLQALFAQESGENTFCHAEQIVAGYRCIVDTLLRCFFQGSFLIRLYVPC